MGSELDCALDLMRRMPPSSIEDNLAGLIDLVPDLTEQLLSMVDQPLKVAHDSQARRDYLLCDYNRDGDSYRYPPFFLLALLAFNYCVTEPSVFHYVRLSSKILMLLQFSCARVWWSRSMMD